MTNAPTALGTRVLDPSDHWLTYDSDNGLHWCGGCGANAKPDGPTHDMGSVLYRCAATGSPLGRSGL